MANNMSINRTTIAFITLVIALLLAIVSAVGYISGINSEVVNIKEDVNTHSIQIDDIYERETLLRVDVERISTKISGIAEDIKEIKEDIKEIKKNTKG